MWHTNACSPSLQIQDTALQCPNHLLTGLWWCCRYVTRKDVKRNAVYISRHYYTEDKARDAFTVSNFNWISGEPDISKPLQCKVRHGPVLYDCQLTWTSDADHSTATVQLPTSDQGLAGGQYAAFYQDSVCLGAGVMQSTE